VGEVTFAVEPLVGEVPLVEGSAVVEPLGEVVEEAMDEGNLRSVGLSTMGFITTVPFSEVDMESGGAVADRAWFVVVISGGGAFFMEVLDGCLRTWYAPGASVLDMVGFEAACCS
jgi:hypothetical protein